MKPTSSTGCTTAHKRESNVTKKFNKPQSPMFVESKLYSDADETLIVSEMNESRHISDMKQTK